MIHSSAIGCPLAIKILLHYGNRTDEPLPNVHAPAVQDEVNRLFDIGALTHNGYTIRITARGLAWIEDLCRVRIPNEEVNADPLTPSEVESETANES